MSVPGSSDAYDAYRACEGSCTHDLARGVLVSELLDEEGPYPDSHPLLTTPRPVIAVSRPLIVPVAP
jgi:hypothetical protein